MEIQTGRREEEVEEGPSAGSRREETEADRGHHLCVVSLDTGRKEREKREGAGRGKQTETEGWRGKGTWPSRVLSQSMSALGSRLPHVQSQEITSQGSSSTCIS